MSAAAPVADAPASAPEPAGPVDRDRTARRATIPLHVDVAALAVVLALATAFVGTAGIVSADEGAVLGQAAVRNETGAYGMRYWAESWDPVGRWFPIHLAERHGDRWYLFTKKPLYVEAVAAAQRVVSGGFAVRMLHLAGVVVASLAAALIARRLRPGTERWTLWATGVGSPLVVDASWVIAHGPAAAAAGLAGLGAVRWWTSRHRRDLVLVSAGLIGAVLLRNEAVLFGLALALGAVVTRQGWSRRGVSLAAVAIGSTGLGAVAELAWQRAVDSGSQAGLYTIRDQVGWVSARTHALWNMLLSPQAPGGPASGVLVGFAAVAIAVGWAGPVRARGRWTIALTGAAAASLAARLLLGGFLVSGLLPAWPLGVAALAALWGRHSRVGDAEVMALLCSTGLLFGVAVLATTYAAGGTGDWGGRYLHLALPLVTPVVVAALAAVVHERAALRPAVRILAVASVLVATMGVVGFHRAARNSATLRGIVAWTDEPGSVYRGATIVTTSPVLGRVAYDRAIHGQMLFIDPTSDIEAEARQMVGALGAGARFAVIAPRADAAALQRGIPAPQRVSCPWDGRGQDIAPKWVYPPRCVERLSMGP